MDVELNSTSTTMRRSSQCKRWSSIRLISKPFIAISIALLFATVCVIGFGSTAENVSSSSFSSSHRGLQAKRGELLIGVADLEPIQEFEGEIRATYDIAVKFQDVATLDYNYHVKSLLDANKKVVIVIEFFSDQATNLKEISGGVYDDYMKTFIIDWKRDGNKEISIRPLHEMNGDWYPWGTYKEGNSPELFIEAFRHIHELFNRNRVNFKMQLAYNCENPNEDATPFQAWWPGDDYVDMILCSGYNRAGTSEWHTEWQTFYDVFGEGYERMAALSTTKPLGIGETSTISQGGNKVRWIKDAFNALVNDFPRCEEADFFFINKSGDDEGDWALNTKYETYAFGNEINKLKGITGAPTTAPTSAPTMSPGAI